MKLGPEHIGKFVVLRYIQWAEQDPAESDQMMVQVESGPHDSLFPGNPYFICRYWVEGQQYLGNFTVDYFDVIS